MSLDKFKAKTVEHELVLVGKCIGCASLFRRENVELFEGIEGHILIY